MLIDRFLPAENCVGTRQLGRIECIVVHYSAGYTLDQCYDTLLERGISAHAIIAQDGSGVRCADESTVCQHAGGRASQWLGTSAVNTISLGVELVNFGWTCGFHGGPKVPGYEYVHPSQADWPGPWSWRPWPRGPDGGGLPPAVLLAAGESSSAVDHRTHRDQFADLHIRDLVDDPAGRLRWLPYPSEQVGSCVELLWEWLRLCRLPISACVGHEHVDPQRKMDPGPLFPWGDVYQRLIDMAADAGAEQADPGFGASLSVRIMQSHLARLGLYADEIDGDFGPISRSALNDAWRRYGPIYGLDPIYGLPTVDPIRVCANLVRIVGDSAPADER